MVEGRLAPMDPENRVGEAVRQDAHTHTHTSQDLQVQLAVEQKERARVLEQKDREESVKRREAILLAENKERDLQKGVEWARVAEIKEACADAAKAKVGAAHVCVRAPFPEMPSAALRAVWLARSLNNYNNPLYRGCARVWEKESDKTGAYVRASLARVFHQQTDGPCSAKKGVR